jgi:hypothetical protein
MTTIDIANLKVGQRIDYQNPSPIGGGASGAGTVDRNDGQSLTISLDNGVGITFALENNPNGIDGLTLQADFVGNPPK